jgi:hypothetical protein
VVSTIEDVDVSVLQYPADHASYNKQNIENDYRGEMETPMYNLS